MASPRKQDHQRWSESELILNISEIFKESAFDLGSNPDPSKILVGIGDDAAVVDRPKAPVVITTDMAVEDVHFKVTWSSAFQIGRKVAAANLADIFAMGGKPKYLTVAMAATGNEELSWMLDVAKGIAHEADIVGAKVVGGDLSRSEKIVISITAIGECEKSILRSGAKVGDQIYLSNLPGWSAAGLMALRSSREEEELHFAISEHLAPSVDYDNAEQMALNANAMCDVSDSLLIQSNQMAEASQVAFEIDGDALKAHPDFPELLKIANLLETKVFDLILSGGEDHVFLATGIGVKGFPIGRVVTGSGVALKNLEKPADGWQHFKN
jgi:thiamine-monophosphate kinase